MQRKQTLSTEHDGISNVVKNFINGIYSNGTWEMVKQYIGNESDGSTNNGNGINHEP